MFVNPLEEIVLGFLTRRTTEYKKQPIKKQYNLNYQSLFIAGKYMGSTEA